MDKIKSFITIILLLVIASILAAVFIPGFIHHKDQGSTELEGIIKHIEDSLSIDNKFKDKIILKDSLIIDSIGKNLSSDKVKVVYLNNNRNEKIKFIAALSNDSLYNYFANFVTTNDIKTR